MPSFEESTQVSECVQSAQPSIPRRRSTKVRREARLAKYERERLVVEYLNRGVSVPEIAAQLGVTEKRMRAFVREILARRMPAPPAEFLAMQVSRLNEALLVAYSAMAGLNLRQLIASSRSFASSTAITVSPRLSAAPAPTLPVSKRPRKGL
jgi:transposase-like protein